MYSCARDVCKRIVEACGADLKVVGVHFGVDADESGFWYELKKPFSADMSQE